MQKISFGFVLSLALIGSFSEFAVAEEYVAYDGDADYSSSCDSLMVARQNLLPGCSGSFEGPHAFAAESTCNAAEFAIYSELTNCLQREARQENIVRAIGSGIRSAINRIARNGICGTLDQASRIQAGCN